MEWEIMPITAISTNITGYEEWDAVTLEQVQAGYEEELLIVTVCLDRVVTGQLLLLALKELGYSEIRVYRVHPTKV